MKQPLVPNSNPDDTRSVSKKKTGLRAVDQGTYRDVNGSLRRLAREIERGEYGDVRDISVAFSKVAANGSVEVVGFHFGTGSRADVHWMLSTVKNRLEPA